jgi:hypothetical protein
MIIKRYDGSNFVELFPKTTTTRLFNSSGATSVFDSNDKINPNFLPNSVFDSLYFFGNVGTNTDIRNLGIEAVDDANLIGRSALGYYWVITTACTISSATGTITVGGITATTSGINPSEEGVSAGTSVDLEVGDWFILTKITGAGTVQSPYSFTFATVNNTYENMLGATELANGAPGIVPQPLIANRSQFLRGDGTWQSANNYVHPNHSGDVTSTADGETVIGAGKVLTDMIANNAVTTDKIINDAVTFAKLQDSAAAGLSVIGRSTSGAAAFTEITGSDGEVLRRTANGLGFGTIVSAGIADNAIIASKINADAVETAKIKDGAVTFSKLPQSSANTSIVGRNVNTTGTYAEIVATDPNLVLRSSDQGGGITSLEFGQVNAGGIADGAISNAKLANTTGFTLKGKSSAGNGAVANLAPQAVRVMSNLAPILFGVTLLDPSTSEPLNTPIAKSNGMADGTEIPEGTIWYDTTVA